MTADPSTSSGGRGAAQVPSSAAAAELVERCRRAGLTLATAESLTGGLVAATIVDVPGASDVLRGGVVAYAPAVKHELLGVDADLLARVGTVHEEVARQMADGARRRLGADLAVATTGVAGPGAAEGHPAGTAWVAAAADGWATAVPLQLDGNRETVRRGCTDAALRLALDGVSRLSPPGGTVKTPDEER